ncbi:Rha family transcriptional regulator [Xenorhabdus bovienii]|uniref:Rha family transcriptional regulator n=1 Tax=Xenorhabdus bovienii TaxID=40576 RepID=UPI0004D5AFF2
MAKKNELITSKQAAMMSSREIAKLTEKEVKNVHVDIWNMLTQLYGIKKDGWNFNHHKNQQIKLINEIICTFVIVGNTIH